MTMLSFMVSKHKQDGLGEACSCQEGKGCQNHGMVKTSENNMLMMIIIHMTYDMHVYIIIMLLLVGMQMSLAIVSCSFEFFGALRLLPRYFLSLSHRKQGCFALNLCNATAMYGAMFWSLHDMMTFVLSDL